MPLTAKERKKRGLRTEKKYVEGEKKFKARKTKAGKPKKAKAKRGQVHGGAPGTVLREGIEQGVYGSWKGRRYNKHGK